MPSPFPGMNPYLEQPGVWGDFHSRFMPLAAEAILTQVRPRYYVKIDEHVYVHDSLTEERAALGRPDIALVPKPDGIPMLSGTAVLAPLSVGLLSIVEDDRVGYLEIIDRENREVVTVVELLSPANKSPGPNRQQYMAKIRRILASHTSIVEVDLLGANPRMPWERLTACDYCVVVSRWADRELDPPHADSWPIRLRDPLPPVPIPLRPGETEAKLDLQALLHRIYDGAGYEDHIYDNAPVPALSLEDQAWADGILGRRPS